MRIIFIGYIFLKREENELFYDELIEYGVESLDDYRGYNEIIIVARDKKFNNNFDNIANSMIAKINVLIEKCNFLLHKKISLYGRIGFEKKKIEDAISEYENIGLILEKISFSIMTSAIASRSSFVMIAPVGLFGNGSTSIFVLSVMCSRSSSFVSRNSFSAFSSIVTGTPPTSCTHGR